MYLNKKKKLCLTTMTIVAALPLFIVACAPTTPTDDKLPSNPPLKEMPPIENPVNPKNALENNLVINNEPFISLSDSFYLMKAFYNGDIIDNEGENQNDGIVKLSEKTSVMLKKGDSLILVFNDNEADSLNINNFAEKLFIENRLLIQSVTELQVKNAPTKWEKIENSEGDERTLRYLTKLTNGQLADKIYGGLISSEFFPNQNNKDRSLLTLRNLLPTLRRNYLDQYYQLVLKYFQIKLVDGQYQYDSSINSANLDLRYMPIARVFDENFFTYQKIAKNAVKFTYNGIEESVPQLNFVLKNRNGDYETLFKALVAGTEKEFNLEKYSKDNHIETKDKFNFVGSYNTILNTQKGQPQTNSANPPSDSKTE